MIRKIILMLILLLGSLNILFNTNEYVKSNVKIKEDQKEVEVKSTAFSDDVKAIFSIPKIDIYIPIFSYDDVYESMNKGMAFDTNTNMPSEGREIVLMGHREKELYKFENLSEDDLIYLITEDGVFTYKVTDLEIIGKYDYGLVYDESSEEELRILTCYPLQKYTYVEGRYLVKAKRIEDSKYELKSLS